MKLCYTVFALIALIVSSISLSSCSKPEPIYKAILEHAPDYTSEYGYWLENGEHYIAGFDNGFAILNSDLELEDVHLFEEPSRVRAMADLSAIYISQKDKVTKLNLSDGSVEPLEVFSSNEFYKDPLWGRQVFAVPHLPHYSSLIYRPQENPFTERRGLWDFEAGRFILDKGVKWDEYYRLGIEDEPLFRIVQSHDANLPFLTIEYRDADANGAIVKVGFGDHLPANHISTRISSTEPGGYIYIDGDILGANVFTIRQLGSTLAMQRRSLEAVEGRYQDIPSIDNSKFHGRIRLDPPFDLIDTNAAATSLILQTLKRLPENKVSLSDIRIDAEQRRVVGQYLLPDYSRWIFRSENGRLEQTQLSPPDTFIGGFENRSIKFENSVLDILVYKPSQIPTKGAVVYVHGGPHLPISRSNLREVKPWLDRGYEIWMLPYYGTVGYGAEFASKIYNGGVEKTGAQLVQALSLVREDFPEELVGVTGNSFGGLVTGLALLQNVDGIDFIWLDMPVISVCDTMSYRYFDRKGEPRDVRVFRDDPSEHSGGMYSGLNGVCDNASKYEVRDGTNEPVVEVYKEAIKRTPILIRHGLLDPITSPEVSKKIGRLDDRHECSGFRSAGKVAHDFGNFDRRALQIDRFMDCVERQ